MSQQTDILLKIRDVAKRLNCSPSNVYALIASGELEAYRVGRGKCGLRFDDEQITAFLERRRTSIEEVAKPRAENFRFLPPS